MEKFQNDITVSKSELNMFSCDNIIIIQSITSHYIGINIGELLNNELRWSNKFMIIFYSQLFIRILF